MSQWWPEPYTDPGAEEEARQLAAYDADLELAEGAAMGDAIHAARQRGVCPHQSAVAYRKPPAYPAQEGLRPGQLRCTDPDPGGCGRVFDSDEDWVAAMDAAARGEED